MSINVHRAQNFFITEVANKRMNLVWYENDVNGWNRNQSKRNNLPPIIREITTTKYKIMNANDSNESVTNTTNEKEKKL